MSPRAKKRASKVEVQTKNTSPKAKKLVLPSEKASKLLSLAEECAEELRFDDAMKACDKALGFEPNNCSVLELKSSVALELDNIDVALQCLDKSISLQPSTGYNKYLSRAQLSTGIESLSFFRKGIEILSGEISKLSPKCTNGTTELNGDVKMEVEDVKPSTADENLLKNSDSSKLQSLTQELSTVYCNIAELFMTDLCDEDDAQEQCEEAIKKAIETKKNNPEPYVVKARFEIILGNMKSAKKSIMTSTGLWFEDLANTPAEKLLNASARLNTAKVLIELKKHSDAEKVLETLLEEDDEIVELWYLKGWNYYLQKEKENSIDFLIKAKKVNHKVPCEDEDLIEHIDELLEELGVALEEIDYEEDSDEENEMSDEEEEMSDEENGMKEDE